MDVTFGEEFQKKGKKQGILGECPGGVDEKILRCYNTATLCAAVYRELNRRGFARCRVTKVTVVFHPRDSNEGYYSVGVFCPYGVRV